MVPAVSVATDEEADSGAYDLADSTEPGSDGRTRIEPLVVNPGTLIGFLKVVEWTPDRFEAVTSTFLIARSLAVGVVLLILGSWWSFRWIITPLGPVPGGRLVGYIHALPFVMTGMGIFILRLVARVGAGLTVDRAERAVYLRGFLGFESVWTADDLGGVVFLVSKPNHFNQMSLQDCETYLIDHEGRVVTMVEQIGFHRRDERDLLARASFHIARILNLPIAVDLKGEPVEDSIAQAVEFVENAGARRTGHLVPELRKSYFSLSSIFSTLALGVGLLGALLFVLKQAFQR